MRAAPLLQFEQIRFGYPQTPQPVLDDFNLEIAPGAVTAILGPNGAGKTTLLHLALGWLHPQAGLIRLERQPLAEYRRRDLGQAIGLVPQSEHVSFEYSLLEFVLLGRAPYLPTLAMPEGRDYEIALDALRQVGMEHLYQRSVLSLSGGERQLVLIARALAQQPRLLLLDEPTSHLDLGNKGRLVRLLRDLQAKGVTILFTTHEPEVAAALATHLVLMQKGQVLKTGPFNEVFTGPDLTNLYQLPVSVVDLEGHKVALWT
ncbi:MAG: ABC transporter ATP-binding protein [Anaerolineales bacterium]|jgi:iron complex transport system ATP-binding protein|nr:ABC transporter ATP-binding protein [Anaerolineales bacterium]